MYKIEIVRVDNTEANSTYFANDLNESTNIANALMAMSSNSNEKCSIYISELTNQDEINCAENIYLNQDIKGV